MKVWVVLADRAKLGDGRTRFFELVDELGSIRKAVDQMGMFSHGHLLRILGAGWVGRPPSDGRLFALATASVSVLGRERETRIIQSWNLAVPPGPESKA